VFQELQRGHVASIQPPSREESHDVGLGRGHDVGLGRGHDVGLGRGQGSGSTRENFEVIAMDYASGMEHDSMF